VGDLAAAAIHPVYTEPEATRLDTMISIQQLAYLMNAADGHRDGYELAVRQP
jgi:hypothetical protein